MDFDFQYIDAPFRIQPALSRCACTRRLRSMSEPVLSYKNLAEARGPLLQLLSGLSR